MVQAIDMIKDVFDNYVEPVAKSFMSGELPSVMLTIHRRGTREKDWLAYVRFKDSLTVSLFKCDVYIDDIYRLCRTCKLYLITEGIFQIAALYSMLHPLYQSQYNDFTKDLGADYYSMMAGAGEETFRFIRGYYPMTDELQKITLDIFKYNMMIFSNHSEPGTGFAYKDQQDAYVQYCMKYHAQAYNSAKYRKAVTSRVDERGLILLERIPKPQEE